MGRVTGFKIPLSIRLLKNLTIFFLQPTYRYLISHVTHSARGRADNQVTALLRATRRINKLPSPGGTGCRDSLPYGPRVGPDL